ncbi:hypothetical protein NECAME_11269 [Necator americanus]|uniref:Uncharacterized protein n=1 Tax=Necator americanus TaxID=51031 RepID=W2T7G6_NECAM|nr:hypothetical protein NECAME_11269 [Necator americanus]ETN77111.1 hypothetical protein NECAME_11269 [Necator americanus]
MVTLLSGPQRMSSFSGAPRTHNEMEAGKQIGKDPNQNVRIFSDESTRSSLSRWGTKKKCRDADPSGDDVIPLPSLILRLDSGDSEKEIRLGSITLCGSSAYVVVDTCEGPSASRSTCLRSGSAPPVIGESEEVNTWLKNEFEQAEVIPMNESQRREQRSRSYTNPTDTAKLQASTDSALMREIESLKQQIKDQSSTFEGHQAQMAKLQEKLTELQTRQAFLRKSEPPPAYVSKIPPIFSETTSRTCVIL